MFETRSAEVIEKQKEIDQYKDRLTGRAHSTADSLSSHLLNISDELLDKQLLARRSPYPSCSHWSFAPEVIR